MTPRESRTAKTDAVLKMLDDKLAEYAAEAVGVWREQTPVDPTTQFPE